jgi:hypothetical protein
VLENGCNLSGDNGTKSPHSTTHGSSLAAQTTVFYEKSDGDSNTIRSNDWVHNDALIAPCAMLDGDADRYGAVPMFGGPYTYINLLWFQRLEKISAIYWP